MKILIVAPHPFYQERGTPIAVDLLIKALSERGYEIDLLTFNEGDNRDYPGLTIHRANPWPEITNVRPGFSLKKLILDFWLLLKFIRLIFTNRYMVVHAVEESAFMALILCPLVQTPFIYDMDSSMVTQIVDKYSRIRWLEKLLRFLESMPMRFASAVVPVCDALADEVRQYRNEGIYVLKDVSLAKQNGETAIDIRNTYEVDSSLLMYIGNLESYQGIDLLLESFALARTQKCQAHLVIIGGIPTDIEKYRQRCIDLNIDRSVLFLGQQPVTAIGGFMQQADILLSPRIQGTNTPMKLFSYLDSGIAVLATDLPTHTQVVTDKIAYLASPTKEALADGIVTLISNDSLRDQLGKQAQEFISKEHSYPAFRHTLYHIYDTVLPQPARESDPA